MPEKDLPLPRPVLPPDPALDQLLASIRLVVLDIDGTLTDGGIYLTDEGFELKRYAVRDGFAIQAALLEGLKVGVITGRASRSVTLRVSELKIPYYIQGMDVKGQAVRSLCEQAGVAPEATAYIGDDVPDLGAMRVVACPIAVNDAVAEVKAAAKFVTAAPGGRGAVREAIQRIMTVQGTWQHILDHHAR